MAMGQFMSAEPENSLGNFALSKDARPVRVMGIHEHAALVEAIMLNFPEIYEDPIDSNRDRHPDAHNDTGPAIQPPSPS